MLEDPSVLVKSTGICRPGQHLDDNFVRNSMQNTQALLLQTPDPQKLCDIMNGGSFKMLNFGIICYSSIVNECR